MPPVSFRQADGFGETDHRHPQSGTGYRAERADETVDLPVRCLDLIAAFAGLCPLWGAALASAFTGAH
jgi:hypothetical protein